MSPNKQYSHILAMNKNRQIISELQSFFKYNNASRAIQTITAVMESLTIQAKVVGSVKNPNCKFTSIQVVKLLMLFPFFSVKTASEYAESGLGKLFSCGKDMFYRLMNDGDIDWRRVICSVNRQLIGKISRRTDAKNVIRCVIIDDTDLPKRGMKAEGLGKIFSHTAMKCILGFKAMFLCYTDGKTQLMLDSTIQAENGKNEDRPQGLTKKQKSAQYTKKRDDGDKVTTRKDEMFQSKIANAIKMLRRAIIEGVRFDYLLVDSWFTCAELIKFIHSRHFKCYFIGMIKMGKTKYETSLGNLKASDIIGKLVKSKSVKYSRSIGYHYASIKATYAGIDVMLFFYRKGSGSWNALLSTDTSIDAKEAFRLYSRRWVIEVAHKEMKGLLNLGKCQCIDFAGQIASLSLCMLQYNILSCVKRFESYETIGGLFEKVTGDTVELSVAQRIWGLIVEVINVIAEYLSCDPFILIENVINNNKQINAVKQAFDRLSLAEPAA